jgi:hypothetical protein
MTTRKNATVKALQSYLAKAKKTDKLAMLEWLIACNTNNERGHVYDQHEIKVLYPNNDWRCDEGASKLVHTTAHTGERFAHICIKRHKYDGWVDNGNQLIAEIECWNELAETKDADYLCPILKYFTSKSDKVEETSKTMVRNVIIIAQLAVYVSNAKGACKWAEDMNRAHGYKGESAEDRYNGLKDLARRRRWWDACREMGGNAGVIFDYSKNCYKAVFIDYAL